MVVTNNVNDLNRDTRQKIADRANEAGMSADQAKTQLEEVGVTEFNPVNEVKTDTANPVETPIVDAPVIEETKIDDPIIDTPKVDTPKVEEIPQTTEGVAGFKENQVIIPKVNTQDQTPEQIAKAKSDALALEEQQKLAKKQETLDYTSGFNNLLSQGADPKDLKVYLDKNKDLFTENKAEINAAYKASITNKKNTDFVNTYGNQSNEQLNTSVLNGDVVIGSNQYNLLSPEKRASYEVYKKQQDSISEKANINTGEASSFQSILSEIKTIFSSDIKKEYTELLNSPKLTGLQDTGTDLANQINSLDDRLEYIREDAIAANPALAQSSFLLNSAVRDEKRSIIRERSTLVNSYNTNLSQIANIKADIQTNLELSQYEDANNKEAYTTALNLYQNEQANITAVTKAKYEAQTAAQKLVADAAKTEFLEANKEKAADVKFQRDLVTKQFEADLKTNDKTGGTYSVDSEGRKIYLLNGVATVVTDSIGDVVYSNEDIEKGFKDTVNFDKDTHIYYTHRVNKDGTIQDYASDVRGNTIGPSLNTVDFIADKEGFRDTAYQDSAGIWTVGYGFTNIDGKPVQKGDTISKTVASDELQKQVSQYTNYEKFVTVDLSEEQKTALNSFEYNLGKGIWNTTGKGIIDAINKGDLETASAIMLAHNKAKDPITGKLKEISGLDNRRKDEAELLSVEYVAEPDFDTTSQVDYDSYLKGSMGASDRTAIIKEFGSMAKFKKQADAYNNSAGGPREQELNSIKSLRDKVQALLDNDTAIDDVTGIIKTAAPWSLQNKNAFLGDIENLLSGTVLQSLIDAKSSGATFGALSNEELKLLQDSSSPLAALIIKNGDGEITGFKGGTENFKKKLQATLDGYNVKIAEKEAIIGKEVSGELSLEDINAELSTPEIQIVDLSNDLGY